MLKRFLFLLIVGIWIVVVSSVAAIGESNKSIEGLLAIVGEDYNIYTFDFENENLNPLTSDADNTRHYQFPTWAIDGRLAYFCCDLRVAPSTNSQAYISPDGIQSSELVYEGTGETIIYAYWSPATCGTDCRDLAMLINNVSERGIALEILRDSSSGINTQRIAQGAPFYYHWDASGTRMVFHRNNHRIDIYDFAQNDISASYNISSGTFQAPAWSPIDDSILLGIPNDRRGFTDLALLENGEIHVLVPELLGLISFLWSPDGRYIAYRTWEQNGLNALHIFDVTSGEIVANSQDASAIAFFWSPDSTKIAYVTMTNDRGRSASRDSFANPIPVQDDSPTQFTWAVLDIETDTNLRYSSFIPNNEMGYLLVYFDQFAPSHRIWSPDSRHLVYSELVRRNNQLGSSIKIIDIEQTNPSPQVITNGVYAVWSFE